MNNFESFQHKPVLLSESIENLDIKENGIYLDGTTGGGGHSLKIAEKLSAKGRLLCIDRDENALAAAAKTLEPFNNITFVHDNFNNAPCILKSLNINGLDGVLLDLGVSSHQLDETSRGFSFLHNGPLDMRMDQTQPFSAFNIVNDYSETNLANIFFKYGEERFSRKIARIIVEQRKNKPIETTQQLADIAANAVPKKFQDKNKHPATRIFQAIRIELNQELEFLEKNIIDFINYLKPSGRICIITFHSLEDRIVKNTFRNLENPCDCPRDLPVCLCGKKALIDIVTKKPLVPSLEESSENPRARSAKLRVAVKKFF